MIDAKRIRQALRLVAALAIFGMAACSSYSPQSLPVGSSVAAATKAMGAPTGDYPMPQGERRLEFARGPFGKQTFMLDFDAQGQLKHWEQVLNDAHFNTIHAGMDQSEVLMQIGHPSETDYIGWQKQVVWEYRYESPFCVWFQVGLDEQGKVVDTAYGRDPLCDDNDLSFF